MSGSLSDLVNRQPVNGGIPITNLRVHGDLLRIVGALKLAIDLVLVLLHNLAHDLPHACRRLRGVHLGERLIGNLDAFALLAVGQRTTHTSADGPARTTAPGVIAITSALSLTDEHPVFQPLPATVQSLVYVL
jgi:hypothetical protein